MQYLLICLVKNLLYHFLFCLQKSLLSLHFTGRCNALCIVFVSSSDFLAMTALCSSICSLASLKISSAFVLAFEICSSAE